jgi:hypothetical protein
MKTPRIATHPGSDLPCPAGTAYYTCHGREPYDRWLPIMWRESTHFSVRLWHSRMTTNPGREKCNNVRKAMASWPELKRLGRWFVAGRRQGEKESDLFVISEASREALAAIAGSACSTFWSAPGGWEDLLLFHAGRKRVVLDSITHEKQAIVYEPLLGVLGVLPSGHAPDWHQNGISGEELDAEAVEALLVDVNN